MGQSTPIVYLRLSTLTLPSCSAFPAPRKKAVKVALNDFLGGASNPLPLFSLLALGPSSNLATNRRSASLTES